MDGIDISNWQRGMDVAATDADFVICKATEGLGFTDPFYENFAGQVLGSGKLLGFYHFARTNGATAEADAFVDAVQPYIGRCLLALDYEADAVDNGASWALEWLDRVTERTGVKPVIYMSKSVCRSDDWREVAGKYKLWAAQYPNYFPGGWQDDPWTDAYGFGAWDSPVIYQYTSVGRISGYSGNLDLNKSYLTAEEWLEMQGSEEDIMASKEEVVSGVVGYTNDDGMGFRLWSDELYQCVWNAGHMLTYKNENVNGGKDLYQLITDAAKASAKVDALEAKVDALETKLDAVLAALKAA